MNRDKQDQLLSLFYKCLSDNIDCGVGPRNERARDFLIIT